MSKLNKMAQFRASQLCIMHFTRSKKIKLRANFNDKILYPKGDPNLDLIFDIDENNFYKGYQLGVTVKATNGPQGKIKTISHFATYMYTPLVIPVLLVIFDIELDKGYYSWINQPTNFLSLVTAAKITPKSVKELNSQGLKEIESMINLYYRNPNAK